MDSHLNRPLKSKKQPSAGQRLKNHLLNVGKTSFQEVSNAKLSGKPAGYEMARQLGEINMMKKLEKHDMAHAAKEARKEEALSAAELKRVKTEQMKIDAQQEKEMQRVPAVMRKKLEAEKRRQDFMLIKAEDDRKKAEEIQHRQQLRKERKLKLRRLALAKKPKEDMSLSDLKCLPELSQIPGLVLKGSTLFDCLKVLQFLHSFGKVLGFEYLMDLDLSVLQEGLLNTGGSMGKVQDLLVSMISSAVQDPGIPAGHRSKTLLGEDLTNVAINRDNVSEILQIYMEAHCDQTESAVLALSLRTKAFQAHSPSQKAYMLSVLVNDLCCSKALTSEIHKKMDYMRNLRIDETAVGGMLRRLRSIHTKRTEKGDDHDEEEEKSEWQKIMIFEEEDDNENCASVEELEKQIEKLCMYQSQIKQKLLHSSHSEHSNMIGQDRYKRRYWLLPEFGGIFVEGIESSEEMLHGWWRVSDMQELHSLVEALHSRGIREKALKKQFQEHMEFLTHLFTYSKDAFDVAKLEKHQVREKTVASWCVEEQAMEVDIHQLQQVEALERRVVSAGLQIKGWMHPEPQSEREDLVYQEDNAWRQPNNPLDIAVMRLAELERGIDRSEEEVTPGMSLWHQALGEVRSSAQLSLCIQQLQKSIDWDRPVKKVENAEFLRSRKEQNQALGGGKRGRDQLDSPGSSAKRAKLAY